MGQFGREQTVSGSAKFRRSGHQFGTAAGFE
jgi:hypothetical protein